MSPKIQIQWSKKKAQIYFSIWEHQAPKGAWILVQEEPLWLLDSALGYVFSTWVTPVRLLDCGAATRKKQFKIRKKWLLRDFENRAEDKGRCWSNSVLQEKFQGELPSPSLFVTMQIQTHYSVSYVSLAWHKIQPKTHSASMIYLAEIKDIQLQRI